MAQGYMKLQRYALALQLGCFRSGRPAEELLRRAAACPQIGDLPRKASMAPAACKWLLISFRQQKGAFETDSTRAILSVSKDRFVAKVSMYIIQS